MNIEDQKAIALARCMDIAREYEKEEVEKWLPPSVQKAWQVGRDMLDFELEQSRSKLKSFTL